MITEPFPIGADAFIIPAYWQAPGAPVGVHFNTMVLRGSEPVVFDTGVAADGAAWLDAVASVVDPADVRWIVLTHDDRDHTGNLVAAMEAFPDATVVTNWFLAERMYPDVPIDPRRQRWVGAGESLDIGDRSLAFVRPPLYDSPTTRIMLDTKTRVLWAGDLFAAPVFEPTNDAADLDPEFLYEGFMQFQRWNSPWFDMISPTRFHTQVSRLSELDIAAIASTHGPSYDTSMVDHAFELLHKVVDGASPPMPSQPDLDSVVAGLMAMT